jgi:acetoacetyl-CoA synthetase
VLFSSGTTGIPKGIVHGHGGILLAHMASLGLQLGGGEDQVFFWYTSTNWMMWNMVMSALLTGATTVTYEGSPGYPTMDRLWEIAESERITMFGTNPGHLQYSANAGLRPGRDHDLSHLTQIGATGSPVASHLYEWVAANVAEDIPLTSSSGGTDVCVGFVGWAPGMPIYPGEIATASLGVAVDAFDASGNPVIDQVGELVVTKPLPSMPVMFWNDPDGSRYRDAYFGMYPGVWRHGDWLTHTSRGTYIIHGRSDATLNRGGVRIGSADLYAVVEAMPEVAEAMVLGVELPEARYWMPMFLVLADGVPLSDDLVAEIRRQLREKASPRHVPDSFYAVEALPHTRTGKKLEVPLKRILQGATPSDVLSLGAVDRPELIDFYVGLARQHARGTG